NPPELMPRTLVASSSRRPRPERVLCALVLALLVLCSASPARAQVVVRVIAGGSAELARKLGSELHYAGFGVQRSSGDGPAPALRVESAEAVELVLARPGDTEVVTQTLIRREQEGDAFALRVVEHLRARLVDLGWSLPDAETAPTIESNTQPLELPPPAPLPPQTPIIDRPALNEAGSLTRRSVPKLWLDAGVHASLAAGGLGLTPHGVLGARLDLTEQLGVSLTGFFPLAFNDVDAAEGEAELAWHVFVAGVDYSARLPEAWFASAGLRAGVLVLDVEGSASGGYIGQSDRLLAGVYGAELDAGRVLLDWLRLRLTLFTGLDAPRPVLRFDEREVAGLGRWFGSVGVSLDVGLALSSEAAP
ncbi:MAG: hypothetical protein ABW217_07460, partial [Polyangiaceae bacterium]